MWEPSDGYVAANVCVTVAQEQDALNYINEVWGADCIHMTPDDDPDDIG